MFITCNANGSASQSSMNKDDIIKLINYKTSRSVLREEDLTTFYEAVVIYESTLQEVDLFCRNNQGLLARIGKFNQEHLTRISYIATISNR